MSTFLKAAHHTPTSNPDRAITPSSNPTTSAAVALNMSWQLLVVIVLPLLGGHLLDTRYHTGPIWMVIGMVVGLAGTIVVVQQTVRQLNAMMSSDTKESTEK